MVAYKPNAPAGVKAACSDRNVSAMVPDVTRLMNVASPTATPRSRSGYSSEDKTCASGPTPSENAATNAHCPATASHFATGGISGSGSGSGSGSFPPVVHRQVCERCSKGGGTAWWHYSNAWRAPAELSGPNRNDIEMSNWARQIPMFDAMSSGRLPTVSMSSSGTKITSTFTSPAPFVAAARTNSQVSSAPSISSVLFSEAQSSCVLLCC